MREGFIEVPDMPPGKLTLGQTWGPAFVIGD